MVGKGTAFSPLPIVFANLSKTDSVISMTFCCLSMLSIRSTQKLYYLVGLILYFSACIETSNSSSSDNVLNHFKSKLLFPNHIN